MGVELSKLNEILELFQSVDAEIRLELLLDFSKRLSPLPAKYLAQRDAGLNRVPECQTPVFLWVEVEHDTVHIHADVAEESPTVKGFVSILATAFNGSETREVADAPSDLLERLGLSDMIRMTRAMGLSNVLQRIKREVDRLGEPKIAAAVRP